MRWSIEYFPDCTHHVFLSHCREDRDALVLPVHRALKRAGVTAWLDQVDYPYGRDSRTALKDSILKSRHVVFFVTPAMISTGRGWCVFELAFAELVRDALHRGESLVNVFLPLFFLPRTDPDLPQTVWEATRDRGNFLEPKRGPKAQRARVGWAVGEITRFLTNEERLAREMARRAARDRGFRRELARPRGMFDRLTRFDPVPLSPAGLGPPVA